MADEHSIQDARGVQWLNCNMPLQSIKNISNYNFFSRTRFLKDFTCSSLFIPVIILASSVHPDDFAYDDLHVIIKDQMYAF